LVIHIGLQSNAAFENPLALAATWRFRNACKFLGFFLELIRKSPQGLVVLGRSPSAAIIPCTFIWVTSSGTSLCLVIWSKRFRKFMVRGISLVPFIDDDAVNIFLLFSFQNFVLKISFCIHKVDWFLIVRKISRRFLFVLFRKESILYFMFVT